MSNDSKLNILDKMYVHGRLAMDETNEQQKTLAKAMISTYVDSILAKEPNMEKNISMLIEEQIANIDQLVTNQLNEVMHHPNFQNLESAWRGLHYLVSNSETGESLKIRLFNCKDEEIRTDLEKAVEFDQSHLFKAVYEEEYGTLGGTPYSVLIGLLINTLLI